MAIVATIQSSVCIDYGNPAWLDPLLCRALWQDLID